MFNPHIHQQQQQQLHQHIRQLQQLFQQQQPPPPPPPPPPQPAPGHHVAHHHQTPRAIPVPPQTAPPPRMVNLCQATQATIIAPNPMLQGALLMQQMQGSMRGFGMGGQQFRQFFATGTRSSLLGPVPMGMAIKSPIMGFPAARPFHPHARFFNATSASVSTSSSISTTDAAARHTDRKRDSDQMATGSTDDQPAAARTSDDLTDKTPTAGAEGGVDGQISLEQPEEPAAKRQRTDELDEPTDQSVVENVTTTNSECTRNTEGTQPAGCSIQEDELSNRPSDGVEDLEEPKADQTYSCLSAQSASSKLNEDDQEVNLPAEETSQDKDTSLASPESHDEEDEAVAEGSNKFYCYLCSITCHNQQNFRSHMNSVSHQQRMMEIQHMSNACLVTLLPRVQESLQGDGEKRADSKHWCATCHTHFTCSIMDHRHSEEHKLASRTDISFCAVCKKRFKTSQNFLEHLHSLEHKQKLQDKGCEALTKLSAMGTDGFSLEEEEEREEDWQKNEGDKGDTQDGWSSHKEVTLNDMASDEQYDPDTVYGSSFLDPAAGFICRLCNKFYLLESSALHTHCKSLKHFENLKRYKALESEKGDAVQASRTSIPPADMETTPDCSQEQPLTVDTSGAASLHTLKSFVTVTRLKMQKENQLEEEQAETDSTLTIPATSSPDEELSLHHEERGSTSQEGPAEEADSELAATAIEGSNGEEEEVAPAVPGKKNGTGRAKTAAKRRSGRPTNRR